ncbi:MAG: sulfatase-like hydrolase/transferase [Oscillospiraceae bacterium]
MIKKTNILLLHADQHRFDCIGCYGNNQVKTPNIDALADEGVRYTEHYTVYPVCTPSRYSMLSGQYTHQHCAWTNVSTLPNGFATFPKLLKEQGYRTTAVGKMHLTPTYHDVGFEKMILSEQNGEGRFEDDYHTYLMEHNLVDAIDLTDQVDEYRGKASKKYYDHFGSFESDLSLEHHSTSWITRQALADIADWNKDGGNLLMVGYIKPHHPFDPPAPYSTMYNPTTLTPLDGYTDEVLQGDFDNHHGFFDHRTLSKEKLQGIMANYYGTITQIDDNIGEIIADLKARGIYDDTLIIYTSDHGEYLGYHHMLLKGNFLYDPLAKIPLIIKYPNSTQKQSVNEDISENIDLCTTILACCGIKKADSMCGIDLNSSGQGREYAFSEGQYGTDKDPCYGYMIRTTNFKLIVSGSFEKAMFFDLQKDKNELHNEINNPVYAPEIRHLKDMLIDKMLFSGGSKNHADHNAPQLKDQSTLNVKTKTLKTFIEGIVNPF